MSIKFIAGLAIGGIIVHFLKTPEGKAFMRRLGSDLSRTEEELACLADGLIQKGKSLISGRVEEEAAPEQLIVVVESNPVV